MDKLIEEISKFNKERDWDQFHSPNNLAKSVLIEAAELLEHFQFDPQGDDLQGIKEEVADVMTYCLMICERYGFSPQEIIREKMKKNAAKYPADKVRGDSRKYNEY